MTIAPEQPTLLLPGFAMLDAGVERYRISAGGVTVVAVSPGDAIEILDPEGGQPCEVAVFDATGRNSQGLIGAGDDGPAVGTQALLTAPICDNTRVLRQLEDRGIDLGRAHAAQVLDADTRPGAGVEFVAEAEAVVVAAAPGAKMSPSGSNPPTDLVLYVRRALVEETEKATLPDPLAEPKFEHTIPAGTAWAYEVQEGDFIQIIDVEGRECSDYQAFDAPQLDKGIERELDATGTRYAVGALYPGPGLFSKFTDQSMKPMVELVQDTCGRHDTFGYACNAKYYEDMGYPGHINCTDNFNKVLAPYGIAARDGWEAINFFYNTNVDANNQMYFDEPWSRPGDYVLMRALSDLVNVSSACPCDIDPANGWVPTDIHVRVYSPHEMFKQATAFRATTGSAAILTRESGFHPRTSELTREFVEYNGFWSANSYRGFGATAEYWACRERVAMIDLSPLRKYEVTGPDAEALMQLCVTRNTAKLAVGQITYTAMCYDTGGMIDDGTVFRLADDHFRWIGGVDTSGIWLRETAAERRMDVSVRSSTNQLHNVQVQGPRSRDTLRPIVDITEGHPDLDELGWFRFTYGTIAGVDVMVSRTGYSGELGFEVFCHPDDAPAVWDVIWDAGQEHEIAPLGLAALDWLRIEAGLIFAGAEFSDQTDPYEAGIGFTVPLKSKEDDFIGRNALVRRKEHPQRKLVGLEVAGQEIAVAEDGVFVGRNQVGVVTSGARSPVLRRNVALARVAVEYAEEGTELQVGKLDGQMKRIPATVTTFPFYDPEKTRVRDVSSCP